MTLGKKAIKSAVSMIISGYMSIIIGFVGNIVLAHLLTLEDFGVFALANSILSIIFMFAGFGSQEAIIQNHDDSLQHFIPTAFWITMAIALALSLLGTAIGFIVSSSYAFSVPIFIVILSWLNFFTASSYVYKALLTRRMAFRNIAAIQFFTYLISFAVAIIAALLGAGPWSLIIREVVATLIGMCAYALTSRYAVVITFNKQSAHAIWTFGWKLMISRISEVIFGHFDNLIVGTTLGTSVLGHYSLAYRLSFLGHQFTQSAIHPVVFSVFSALQNAPQQLQTAFTHMMYWLVRIAFLLGLFALVLGQDVVRLVYTDKWALAGVIFQNMWPFLGLLPIHEAVRHVMIGAGAINRVVLSRFVMLSFFVPSLLLAGLSGEILAVVWAVNLSLLLSLGLMLYHLAQGIQVRWFFIFTNPTLAGLATLIVTLIIDITLNPGLSLIWIVMLHAALVLFLYCGFLLLLERKTIQSELGLIWARLVPNTTISV